MATFTFLFGCAADAIRGLVVKPRDQGDAVSVLEDVDRYRDLTKGVAIVCFFVSAGFAVFAFFLINESVLWAGVSKQVAYLLVSVSWVLIFPIWALVFLGIMAVLDAMGIKVARSVAS